MLLSIQALLGTLIFGAGVISLLRGDVRRIVTVVWSLGVVVAAMGWSSIAIPPIVVTMWCAERWRLQRLGRVAAAAVVVGMVCWLGVVKAEIALSGALAGRPVLLPLGLSFLAFSVTSAVIDARRDPSSRHSFLEILGFVSFAPVRLAGPAMRIDRFSRSFRKTSDVPDRSRGWTLIALGLAKKRLVADVIFSVAVHGTGTLTVLERVAVGVLAVCSAYFDASGYSDIAQGAGALCGVTVPACFSDPLTKASSLSELWRRWQVPIMGWFRDYVYGPVRSRWSGPNAANVALVCSFLVSSLWHGFHPVWLIWGSVTIGLLLAEQRTISWTAKLDGSAARAQRVVRRLLVWGYLAMLLTLLRSADPGSAATINGFGITAIRGAIPLAGLSVVAVLAVFGVDAIRPRLVTLPKRPGRTITAALISVVLVLLPGGMVPFVYQSF